MQFFISHLARWHRTRHFSEPTAKTNAKPMMDNKNEIPKQQIKSLINKTDGAPTKNKRKWNGRVANSKWYSKEA